MSVCLYLCVSGQGVDFSRVGQCDLTPISLEYCSRLPQSRCRCYWLFAAYSAAALIPYAFQWSGQPQNCPFPWESRKFSTPFKSWFLQPQTASRSVQPVLQCLRTWPTNTQTTLPYSVCSNNMPPIMHWVPAMRPKMFPFRPRMRAIGGKLTVKFWNQLLRRTERSTRKYRR